VVNVEAEEGSAQRRVGGGFRGMASQALPRWLSRALGISPGCHIAASRQAGDERRSKTALVVSLEAFAALEVENAVA